MAQHPLINATVWLSQFDISADHNQVRVMSSVESLDKTVFGQTTRIHGAGLRTGEISGEGFLDYGTNAVEEVLSARIGLNNVPITVTPNGLVNERAVFMQSLVANVSPIGGTIGEMHKFSFKAEPGQNPLIRGTLMAAKASRTSTGNSGTAQQLGAVTAPQRIYGVLHVFSASGSSPTLDVTVQSDNAVGFPSLATQITFAQATGVTSEFKSTAGAITDDWWRVAWTIGGSSPNFSFAVAIGIL